MKLILLLFTIPVLAFGQASVLIQTEPIPANFELAMSVENPTEAQFDSIFSLTTAYVITSGDSSLTLAQKAVELAEGNPVKRLYINALLRLGDAYRVTGDGEKSKEILTETLEKAKAIGNQFLEAEASNGLGLIEMNAGKYKNALEYFIGAANIFEKLDDKKNLSKVYFNMGVIFFRMAEPNKVQFYVSKVNEIAEVLDDDNARMEASGLRGSLWIQQGNAYNTKLYDDSLQQRSFKDSAAIFYSRSEFELNKSLAIAKKLGNQRYMVISLNNLVALNLNLGNYPKALTLAKEAEGKAETLGEIGVRLQSIFNLSGAYQMNGDYVNAAEYGKKGLALAQEKGMKRQEMLAKSALYNLYKLSGDYKQAIPIGEDLRAYDNEIKDSKRNKDMATITAQYEKVKDEKKILELEDDKKQRGMIIGGGLLMLVLGLIAFQLNKTRKDRNDKMAFAEALLFAQEGERKRIARDLHDGVGQSLLLVKKQMGTSLQVSAENQQLITDTLEEVRSISQDLHPIQLEKLGLTNAIHDVIEKVERSTDLFITKEIINLDDAFSEKGAIHVFRVLQEALSNIVKHADATAARITIESVGRNIVIKVMDNGKGFDYELAVIQSKSLGLRTMHERVSSMGGQMKIEKNDPSGVITTFTIPQSEH